MIYLWNQTSLKRIKQNFNRLSDKTKLLPALEIMDLFKKITVTKSLLAKSNSLMRQVEFPIRTKESLN